MGRPDSRRPHVAGVIAGVAALVATANASALTLTTLRSQGLESIYGSYAPLGDCALEPRIVIDEAGFSFHANGQTRRSHKFEHALTFMGARYEGIVQVFFPFPAGAGDFGPLIMTVNAGEKPGAIRLESDLPPDRKPDPFHGMLTRASPYQLCKEAARAAPAAAVKAVTSPAPPVPLDWKNMPALVDNIGVRLDPFDNGPIAALVRARVGRKIEVLKTNMSVITPLGREGQTFHISGNAQHQGGMEQAYILIDAARREVQVGLWERGRLAVYAPKTGRIPPPDSIRRLLSSSPPETAVPAPGTPWEVVPVPNRSPLAHVAAAASPSIESFSLFCESGRPMMAMLLNTPSSMTSMTVTWVFAGGLVNVPVVRGNRDGTFWRASLAAVPLVPMLTRHADSVFLRINGRTEGEASLAGAADAVRVALRTCQRF